jgi:heme/copper-type cytochrome/quinol oxidase subunit 2
MWLITNSFFTYDGINQLALAVFLYFLVRYRRSAGRRNGPSPGIRLGSSRYS